MPKRPSLWQKVWSKLRGRKTPAPAPAPRGKSSQRPQREPSSLLEPLEGRIAPASLINPTTVMYKDIDGDIVTIKFSKPLFTSDGLANDILTFTQADSVTNGPFNPATAVPEQLQLINVATAALAAKAQGLSITITSVKGSLDNGGTPVDGDGFAHVGYIKAIGTNSTQNVALGTISINGDLGQIDAGKAGTAVGVTALKLKSMGAFGTSTQAVADRSLESTVIGSIGSITITDDVKDVAIRAVNGFDFSGKLITKGKIGSITIGGSLIGRTAMEAASDNTGLIQSANEIGVVKIGNTPTEGIIGGGGKGSGVLRAYGSIASVTLGGDLVGGTGAESGRIEAGTVLTAATINDDIIAGVGTGSGVISSTGTIGTIKVLGDIDATTTEAGTSSGGIKAWGKITSVTVLGALRGGGGIQTGFIESQSDLGTLVIHDILGGSGQNSGTLTAGAKLAALTVAGNIQGGAGFGSGSVYSGTDSLAIGDMGAIKVGGFIKGGTNDNTGLISAGGKITSVTIGPATAPKPADLQVLLQGGTGDYSGTIFSRGVMGTVKITGHVEGGSGDYSGSIISRDKINAVSEIAGDMGAITISGHLKGGSGDDSGALRADGKLTSATIGNLLGSTGERSGAIYTGQGIVKPGITGAIKLNGSMIAGAGDGSGSIVSEGKLTSVTITGGTSGGQISAGDDLAALTVTQDLNGTVVSARGQAIQPAKADLAIGKVTVNGNVIDSQILAGYNTALQAVNPDAQIGTIAVKLAWTASDVVAGIVDGGNAGFGTTGDMMIDAPDNAAIVSQIASIIIGGAVTGTAGTGDHFGFTAQKIGIFKAGGIYKPMNTLADGQVFELNADTDNDVTVREIPLPSPV